MADTDSGSDCSDESFADRIQRAQDDDSEDSDASEESDESEDSECSDDSTESAVVDDLHDYELYDATKPTLIIGIDLGTTYSGVAYAFASNPKEIFNVEDWPHAAGKAYEKCPTVLSYGSTNKIKWGFAVSDHDQGRIEAFKLLLDPEQRRPDYAPARDAQRAIRRLPKSVVDVVADYLRLLWNHSLKVIASKYPPGFLNHVQKRFFLTVPAVWSDRAKIKTLKAARRANIRPAKLVKEPEAAALWTTTGLAETWLSAGDAVVVCDAGGGTVDLITYELFGPRPLKLKELVQAQGGIFGSKLINDRFEKHLQGVIGEEQFTTFSRTQSFRAGMTAFNDLIKPAFCTGERRARTLNFPRARLKDNRDKGLERDTLKITWDTLNRFFYPVANDVAKLVTTQVNAARIIRQRKKCHNAFQIKAIFLVGGFGASEYLKQEIERQNPGILVIRPTNAWSAIARGATVSGLPQQTSVAANVAPKHYGVSGVEFDIDPIKDAGRPTTIDPHTGRRQIKKMTWYIYRGQELDRARPIAFDWFMNFPENPSDDVLEENPIRLWESVQRIAQRHPDRKMSTNCVLWPLLSKVPKEFFERKSRLDASGRLIKWWRLDFKILITVQSGPMKFTLNCRGRQYGSINANY